MHADLIARLEAATGEDVNIDFALQDAVYGRNSRVFPAYVDPRSYAVPDGNGGWVRVMRPSGIAATYDRYVPRYTASLDAALTLVPEGWEWTVRGRPHGDGLASIGRAWESGSDTVIAATPALALCIAALRARANEGDPR
jgi:hypothetical protein